MLLALGLLLFVALVVAHEYGHFIAARKSGVDVEEFGIGFPPRIWSKKLKSKLLLSINLLPLGGFVRLKGENDSDAMKGSYGSANLSNKVKIMTAGVLANLLIAVGLLFVLALVGMPKLVDNQFVISSDIRTVDKKVLVGTVNKDSPAKQSGIQVGDQLLNIAPYKVNDPVLTADELPGQTKKYAGQRVDVSIKRGENILSIPVNLLSEDEVEQSRGTSNPRGYLGVTPTTYELQRSTWSAPIVAVGQTIQFSWLTIQGVGSALGDLVTGNGSEAADQVAGPVGIFVVLKDGTLLGIRYVLFIVALISLTLAIMNILPIPALDGGRLFVTLLFRAINKPLTKETENAIHGIGFMVLMLLFVLITIVDVKRFF